MGDMTDFTFSTLTFSKAHRTSSTQSQVDRYTQNVKCRCGKPMEKKYGQYGAFWGCTNFPTCTGSRGIIK